MLRFALFLFIAFILTSCASSPKRSNELTCHIILSDKTGDFKRLRLPKIDKPTTQATGDTFVYRTGVHCNGKRLDGYVKFKDRENGIWQLKLNSEPEPGREGFSMLSASLENAHFEVPQMEFVYHGEPCDPIKVGGRQMSWVSLETKSKKFFTASLTCDPIYERDYTSEDPSPVIRNPFL